MTSQIPLWIIPFFPLIGALLLGAITLAQAKSEQPVPEAYIGALAVSFPLFSFVATVMFALGMPEDGAYAETLGDWISIGDFQISFGFLFDSLTKTMLLFVTGITTLIVLYSIGYMKGDSGYTRFMCYMNLFLFSMIVLVLSDSLPLTFLGWEGVGLCSYLLVGFWNKDLLNCKAANKALLVNRVGDVGFLLGMFILMALGGTSILNYTNLNEAVTVSFIPLINLSPPFIRDLVLVAALFLFFACTAKSAQIPLLTWLPDAMAGPTPVSALIHAATMVTAGVYLMARLYALFVFDMLIPIIVLIVALATAFWAAVAGLVQHDIKKVLAYSTISQLGFMFLAAGVGAFDVAIFHVFTHAFTKAALFLGAGSVIHAMGGEQDIRKMGGLALKLPSTFLIMLLAWASLIGLPGLACFWSKDLILESVFGTPVYYVALITALLTAIYMTRLMVLVFLGKFRGDKHTAEHLHESPIVMQAPMWILAVGCIFAGYAPLTEESHLNISLATISSTAAVLGLVFAGFYFRKRIPKYPGHNQLVGFARIWTFSFDALHYVCGVLPVRIAVFFLDLVNQFLRTTMYVFSIVPYICAEGLRFMQANKLRVQLALSVISSVVLIYWLVFFVR
ncbi:MAG: NADH-quinone oxidoreductase subunit L [Fibromonadaceae bacterium]|jgi:NADH-quinone oxidoreductase subunit L|nr:NADH-quinone oxidoreductase subunit L [Fibromonadaceae bacterium]